MAWVHRSPDTRDAVRFVLQMTDNDNDFVDESPEFLAVTMTPGQASRLLELMDLVRGLKRDYATEVIELHADAPFVGDYEAIGGWRGPNDDFEELAPNWTSDPMDVDGWQGTLVLRVNDDQAYWMLELSGDGVVASTERLDRDVVDDLAAGRVDAYATFTATKYCDDCGEELESDDGSYCDDCQSKHCLECDEELDPDECPSGYCDDHAPWRCIDCEDVRVQRKGARCAECEEEHESAEA